MLATRAPYLSGSPKRLLFGAKCLVLRSKRLLAILTVVDNNLEPDVVKVGYHACEALLLLLELLAFGAQLG